MGSSRRNAVLSIPMVIAPEVTVSGKWPVEQWRAGQWIPQRSGGVNSAPRMLSRRCAVTLSHFGSKERVHPSRQQSAVVRGNRSWHSDACEKHLWLGQQKPKRAPPPSRALKKPPDSRPTLITYLCQQGCKDLVSDKSINDFEFPSLAILGFLSGARERQTPAALFRE